MTREEKSKAVSDFCDIFFDANETGCFGCPLAKDVDECTDRNDVENYDILVKAGLIAPDDEIETANDELDEAHKRFMNIGDAEVERKVESMVNPNATQIYDTVHSPSHYCKGGIECINAIKASMTSDGFCDYCKGNVLKYIWRWRDKGGAQDLEKAKVYLDWLIEAAKGESK